MILLVDNYDSFTYNLVDYFAQIGVTCHVVANDIEFGAIPFEKYSGIVLSPGPGRPDNSGITNAIIKQFLKKLPILGICLGHQAIGMYFGASLQKALKPMHGKISSVACQKDYLFEGLPGEMEIVRYHSLVLHDIPSSLEVIASTAEGEVMAIRHKDLPIRGLQFHPEAALTLHGMAMLRNWVKFNNIVNLPA